ncbi:DUF4307 domain-containing protein [Terrabacter sp. NPDC080008]|uniref:DUF4307 domain-containing protein n=1 Tax=Terrabacter sp. NPDC080008 TaxID=3155176 RepID=UPI00344F19FB
MPSRPTLPRPAPGQLKWWVIGTVGILAGVALATWLGLSATLGQPSWDTLGYKVVSDQQVRVDFQVYRPGGTALTCTVEALAIDFSPVGTTTVQVPASTEETTKQSAMLRTTSRAVTGQVTHCS